MSNFDDDMFNEDDYKDDVTQELSNQDDQTVDEQPKDLTAELLKIRGIEDSSKIKFEDETGATIERSWDDLSDNEKLNILAGEQAPVEDDSQQLDEDEIQLINAIRNSGMNVQQYMNNISPAQAPAAYNPETLSDDELYALNILQTVGSDNITDEELEQAIANAKENEDLYNRTVNGLRQQYQQLQADEQNRLAQEQLAKQQEQYNAFANVVDNNIQNFSNFAGQDIELDNDEKQQLRDYMLTIDNNTGLSNLGKDLQNPETLVKAAFWILNEDKIMSELTKQAQDAYRRGYNAGKATSKATFIKKPQSKPIDKNFDDDDWD